MLAVIVGINILFYRSFAVREISADYVYQNLMRGSSSSSGFYLFRSYSFLIFVTVSTFYYFYLYTIKKILKGSRLKMNGFLILILCIALFTGISYQNYQSANERVDDYKERVVEYYSTDMSLEEEMQAFPAPINDTSNAWFSLTFSGVAIIILLVFNIKNPHSWRSDRFRMRF